MSPDSSLASPTGGADDMLDDLLDDLCGVSSVPRVSLALHDDIIKTNNHAVLSLSPTTNCLPSALFGIQVVQPLRTHGLLEINGHLGDIAANTEAT